MRQGVVVNRYYILFFLLLGLCPIEIGAGVRDVIGTTNIQYQQANQVFPKGSSLAQGFVRFNDGLTVAREANVQLDTFITVSGGLDIRSSGTIDILSDLYLASNFTFSSSDFIAGFIKGRGNTIHFAGDTYFQESQTLKIIGDTIIDGGGHDFIFGPYAQLLVDHDVTLTLKNMRFIHTRNSISRPSIALLASSAKLALQNVTLSLSDDFSFNKGSLFIHGDVVVTGSSTFAYRSAQPCCIDTQSIWLFNNGTRYFHDPRSTENNQLFMRDNTSTLAFNNATLLTTHTGMRLTRGLLCLDNGVTFSSSANTRLTGLDILGTSVSDTDFIEIKAGSWSNDGFRAAMVGVDSLSQGRLEVFTFDGATLSNQVAVSDSNFSVAVSMAWTQDDRYIAMAGEDLIPEGKLQIYKYEGVVLLPVGALVTDANFAHINSVTWSIDGRYVIVVGEDASLAGSRYSIYGFDGFALSLIESASDPDFDIILSVSWSPDNNYILMGGFGGGSGQLKVFTFDGISLTAVGGAFPALAFVAVRSCEWSPDGLYAVAGGQDVSIFNFGQTEVFAFDGLSLSSIGSSFNDINFTNIFSVSWAPDGRSIMAGGTGVSFGLMQTYIFDGSSVVPAGSLINETTFFSINAVDWSPDDRSILALGQSPTSEGQRAIYAATYGFDTSPQGFRNGIIFGNAALGQEYDLDVEVFGGARVVIDGKLLYDNYF